MPPIPLFLSAPAVGLALRCSVIAFDASLLTATAAALPHAEEVHLYAVLRGFRLPTALAELSLFSGTIPRRLTAAEYTSNNNTPGGKSSGTVGSELDPVADVVSVVPEAAAAALAQAARLGQSLALALEIHARVLDERPSWGSGS